MVVVYAQALLNKIIDNRAARMPFELPVQHSVFTDDKENRP